MSEREHIGFYCGLCPDFMPALREARRRWPDARLTAIVPPSYAPDEAIYAVVDDLMVTGRDAYSPLHPLAVRQLAADLRARGFSHFITLFRTTQQRILALVSGASRAELWDMDSRIRPMEVTWSGLIRGAMRRSVGGRLRYLGLFLYACIIRVPRSR